MTSFYIETCRVCTNVRHADLGRKRKERCLLSIFEDMTLLASEQLDEKRGGMGYEQFVVLLFLLPFPVSFRLSVYMERAS